jgi:hypothetical protein
MADLLNTVLKVMGENPAFDKTLPVAQMIGKYIKGGGDRSEYKELMQKVSFADRDEIARKQETAEFESLQRQKRDDDDRNRTETIRENTKSALSGIYKFQHEESRKSDINAEKSAKFGEKLSVEQKTLYNKVEAIKVENAKLLKTQREEFLEWIRDEREKIGERFDISSEDLSRTQQGIESVIKEIEAKRFSEKVADKEADIKRAAEIEASKPPPRQTQRIEIKETGQIITIAK